MVLITGTAHTPLKQGDRAVVDLARRSSTNEGREAPIPLQIVIDIRTYDTDRNEALKRPTTRVAPQGSSF